MFEENMGIKQGLHSEMGIETNMRLQGMRETEQENDRSCAHRKDGGD